MLRAVAKLRSIKKLSGAHTGSLGDHDSVTQDKVAQWLLDLQVVFVYLCVRVCLCVCVRLHVVCVLKGGFRAGGAVPSQVRGAKHPGSVQDEGGAGRCRWLPQD